MGELPKLLFREPVTFILIVIPLLYSVILHEVAHGWVAYRMGDPTAKLMGRLSLDPRRHLDPIGTLLLFIVGFGWAKPVPVNFNQLRNKRMGMILVSAAGIVTNIIVAFFALLLYRLISPSPSSSLNLILYVVAQINIILAAFNLIPLPPLDGSKILLALASAKTRAFLLRVEPYGLLIIIGLLYAGFLDPVIHFLQHIILVIIDIVLP